MFNLYKGSGLGLAHDLNQSNYSGLICNADSSRRRGFITSTESSYRNIKKKDFNSGLFSRKLLFSAVVPTAKRSVVKGSPPRFITVSITERITANLVAPWVERNWPEIFCLTLTFLMARSEELLSGGTSA